MGIIQSFYVVFFSSFFTVPSLSRQCWIWLHINGQVLVFVLAPHRTVLAGI